MTFWFMTIWKYFTPLNLKLFEYYYSKSNPNKVACEKGFFDQNVCLLGQNVYRDQFILWFKNGMLENPSIRDSWVNPTNWF